MRIILLNMLTYKANQYAIAGDYASSYAILSEILNLYMAAFENEKLETYLTEFPSDYYHPLIKFQVAEILTDCPFPLRSLDKFAGVVNE